MRSDFWIDEDESPDSVGIVVLANISAIGIIQKEWPDSVDHDGYCFLIFFQGERLILSGTKKTVEKKRKDLIQALQNWHEQKSSEE